MWPSVCRCVKCPVPLWRVRSPRHWILYILVPLGFSLLAIQSLSELVKRVAYLTGHGPDPHAKPEKTDEEMLLEELQHELQMEADMKSGNPSAKATGSAANPTRNTP